MRFFVLLSAYYTCAFWTLLNPFFGLLFFAHITILKPENLLWEQRAFGRLHLITGILMLLGYLVGLNKRHYFSQTSISPFPSDFQKKSLLIFLSLVAWFLLASIFAEFSVQSSLNQTLEVIKIFLFCFLFSKLVNSEHRIGLYVWVLSISFGLLSLWVTQQGLLGGAARVESLVVGGSNFLGAELVLIIPLILFKVLDQRLSKTSRRIFGGCGLVSALAVICSGSRGAIIGACVALFVLLLNLKQRAKAIVGFTVMIALIYPLLSDFFLHRMSSIFADKDQRDVSAASRPVMWRIALRIWEDHPILGVGLQNFSPVKETYVDRVRDIVPEEMFADIFGVTKFTHGLYPGIMAETGSVGLVLFLMLLCRAAFHRFPPFEDEARQSLSLQAKGAQAGLIGFSVAAVFGDFQYIDIFYWQVFFVGAVENAIRDLEQKGAP